MLEKVGENLYRSHAAARSSRRRIRLGYAAQGTDYQFSKEISAGLQRAAAAQGIELICRRQPLQREDRAAQRRRPGAREGRPRHRVPDRRARRADRRGEVPRGGHSADRDRDPASRRDLLRRQQLRGGADRRPPSRALGEAAAGYGDVDEIVFIALRSRRQPAADAPHRHAGRDEGGLSGSSRTAASPIWTATASSARASRRCASTCAPAKSRRFLIGAINDPSALGALRAMQEAGRVDSLRDHGAERVAGRARGAAPARHAPDRIGRLLPGKVRRRDRRRRARHPATAAPVPPAVFVKHQLVTPENVDHIYPNDRLMQTAG